MKYDIVIWNFPCIRIENGMDGQVSELQLNQQLLSQFFKSVQDVLEPLHGEVHVVHKTIEPFSWWDIKDLAKRAGLRYVICANCDSGYK